MIGKNLIKKYFSIGAIFLLVGISITPIISGNVISNINLENKKNEFNDLIQEINSLNTKVLTSFKEQKNCSIILYTFDNGVIKENTVTLNEKNSMSIYNAFQKLSYKITHEPFDEETETSKQEFINLLDENDLIPEEVTKEYVLSLLNPIWLDLIENTVITNNLMMPLASTYPLLSSKNNLFQLRQSTDLPTSLIYQQQNIISEYLLQNNKINDIDPTQSSQMGSAFLCSMSSGGAGLLLPPIMLPRPRVIMLWKGYPSTTLIAELYTGHGFIASGNQIGYALLFLGIGFAFAIPGVPVFNGFVGYAIQSTVWADSIEFYPLNREPTVSEIDPPNDAIYIPRTLSELSFRLYDADGDKMSYDVTTSPNIGGGSDDNVNSGTYTVPVSGLEGSTTYSWEVEVSDGTFLIAPSFSFTTAPVEPVIQNPFPAYGEVNVPVTLSELRFDLIDFDGDLMDFTVETSPYIGSETGYNVGDGIYYVDVDNLDYSIEYNWYVNVTDGEHWTKKNFNFLTEQKTIFDPFEEGWQYRKKITMDHTQVVDNLVNFPILVSTIDNDLHYKAQIDGDDILFMDGPGVANRLFHEIEKYDGSSGELIAWVNTPSLSSSQDTEIYMYYGNLLCSNQENIEETWDSNFKGVYHLNEQGYDQRIDSSGEYDVSHMNYDGDEACSGKIGGADDFDGNNDYLKGNTNSKYLNGPEGTMSAWIKTSSPTVIRPIISKHQWEYIGWFFFITPDRELYQIYCRDGGAHGHVETESDPLTWDSNSWYYVAVTRGPNGVHIYRDGDLITHSSATYPHNEYGSGYFNIGSLACGDYGWYFDGIIDEARVSLKQRSDGWIKTSYNNQNDPDAFMDFGPEETTP